MNHSSQDNSSGQSYVALDELLDLLQQHAQAYAACERNRGQEELQELETAREVLINKYRSTRSSQELKINAQLPEEMQDCTVRFVECPEGHGRLIATNWVDHGCPSCTIKALRKKLDTLSSDPTLPNTKGDPSGSLVEIKLTIRNGKVAVSVEGPAE